MDVHIWYYYHYYNRFMALFPGPPRWADARRELLDFMVRGKINRGRHTDHPAGRHSIRTNQCPSPPSPHLYTPDTCWTKLNQIHICTDFRIQCTLLAPGKSCTDHYVYIICHKSEAVLTITSTVLSYRVTEYWRKQCSEVKAEVKPLHVRATEAFALRLLLVTALDKQVHT